MLLALLASLTEVVSSHSAYFDRLSKIPTDEVLLTPFRTENVPPPMSSHQLKTSLSTPSGDVSSAHIQTPVHISLSPTNDLLASVWQSSHLSVWSLNTRIGPGKGKAVDPTLIWTVNLRDGNRIWRQVSVSDHNGGEKRTIRALLLGAEGGSDYVAIHEFSIADGSDDKAERGECFLVKMPGTNGRLTATNDHLFPVWQNSIGQLFEGWVTPGLAHSWF